MKTALLSAIAASICLGTTSAQAGSFGMSVGYHSGPLAVQASYGHGYYGYGPPCYAPPPPVYRTTYYYAPRRHYYYHGPRHHYKHHRRHHHRRHHYRH